MAPGRAAGLLLGLLGLATLNVDAHAWRVHNQVIVEHGELAIDHGKSIAEITRAQAEGGFPAALGVGLFQNRMRVELVGSHANPAAKPATDLATDPAARVNRLSLTTRVTTAPVIYVAREFPADSCAYRVILAHEHRHWLLDRDVLRALPGEIRAITRQIFATGHAEEQGRVDLESARRRFLRQVEYAYDSLSLPLHQAIDNPESYQALSRLCAGEIGRRLAELTKSGQRTAATPKPGPR